MNDGTIWIGNDHGGYDLKLKIMNYLEQNGIPVCNLGSDSTEIVRYPHYAVRVASAVSRGSPAWHSSAPPASG
jgi:ribose 5-phosphate isomerase B